jgi:hypothetical protein
MTRLWDTLYGRVGRPTLRLVDRNELTRFRIPT